MGSRTITDDECKAIADLVAFRTGDYIPEFQVKAIIETFINRPIAKPTCVCGHAESVHVETRVGHAEFTGWCSVCEPDCAGFTPH